MVNNFCFTTIMVVIPHWHLLVMLPALVWAQSTCNQPGLCEGSRIGVGIAISHDDCQVIAEVLHTNSIY